MKYLEQKDPDLHIKAKLVVKECAEKNRQKVAGYESVTAAMQNRLRSVVGEAYWKKSQDYMRHYAEQAKLKYLLKARAAGTLTPEQEADLKRLYEAAKRRKAADEAAKAAAAAAGMNQTGEESLPRLQLPPLCHRALINSVKIFIKNESKSLINLLRWLLGNRRLLLNQETLRNRDTHCCAT